MTFGEALRDARASRGWSRSRLIIAIRARLADRTITISEETIRDLEEGVAKCPQDKTWGPLVRVLPELCEHFPVKPQRVIHDTIAA